MTANARVRVLLVDDHAVLRQGLRSLLSGDPELEVVGDVRSVAELVAGLAVLSPDVILMDLAMPESDGIDGTRRARELLPDAKVVMLTSFSDSEQVNAALDAGAVGYILKDAEPGEIIQAVKVAARGEAPFSPRAAGALLQRRAQRRVGEDLTPREREVLELVRQGLANKQISRKLGIREKTVKAHLTSVFQRIGVADRTAAALWADRHLT